VGRESACTCLSLLLSLFDMRLLAVSYPPLAGLN
jgi:hypothetical protein